VDNIPKVVTEQLKALTVEEFQPCYRVWEQLFRLCVAFQENYFDWDYVDFYFS
jgi:hypothetical protein